MPTILEPTWLGKTYWEWSLSCVLVFAYVVASLVVRRTAGRHHACPVSASKAVDTSDAPRDAVVRSHAVRRSRGRRREVALRRWSRSHGENRQCGRTHCGPHCGQARRHRDRRRIHRRERVQRPAARTAAHRPWKRPFWRPTDRARFVAALETSEAVQDGIWSASAEPIAGGVLEEDRVQIDAHADERRVVFCVRVTCDTPHALLKRIPDTIREIVAAQDDTRFERSHFVNIGAASLDFETVYYVLSSDYFRFLAIQYAIFREVREAFVRDGIRLAYPN